RGLDDPLIPSRHVHDQHHAREFSSAGRARVIGFALVALVSGELDRLGRQTLVVRHTLLARLLARRTIATRSRMPRPALDKSAPRDMMDASPRAIPMQIPKACFFDVFGTLVDWRNSIAREAEAALKPLGHKLDWLAFADAWRG